MDTNEHEYQEKGHGGSALFAGELETECLSPLAYAGELGSADAGGPDDCGVRTHDGNHVPTIPRHLSIHEHVLQLPGEIRAKRTDDVSLTAGADKKRLWHGVHVKELDPGIPALCGILLVTDPGVERAVSVREP